MLFNKKEPYIKIHNLLKIFNNVKNKKHSSLNKYNIDIKLYIIKGPVAQLVRAVHS